MLPASFLSDPPLPIAPPSGARARSDVAPRKAAHGFAAMPFGGFPETARTLAELAADHAERGELREARSAAYDALLVLDTLDDTLAAARVSLTLGDVLLRLHEAHRARERFEAAVAAFDALSDVALAARARLGAARALLMLGDPAGRAALEDAGTLYEDLGDEDMVRAIDRALREAQADFEESPRSFSAGPPRALGR